MRKSVSRMYQQFREPKNFLVILVAFIVGSLTLHWMHHYDPDFGATNLVLSIEASVASAALMLLAREPQRANDEARELHGRMLQSLISLAQLQREADAEQSAALRRIEERQLHAPPEAIPGWPTLR